LIPATEADFDELIALRIAAMRESLERVGRYDPERARERLRNSFYPEYTRFIVANDQRIGFYTFRPIENAFSLDHFYILPAFQSQGIGSLVLCQLLSLSDAHGLSVHVGALRESASNRFYRRHGFTQIKEDEWDIYYSRAAVTERMSQGFNPN
jgi:ribosomal protein S18 acetylase RimI-like enzyme